MKTEQPEKIHTFKNQYKMDFNQPYTDDTILTDGPHKFTRLIRVPPAYLLEVLKNRAYADKRLLAYIEKNLETIKARDEGKVAIPRLIVCKKTTYPSEEAAKEALRNIQSKSQGQDQKRPFRCYECNKCSGWHLTSLPLRKWKKKFNRFNIRKKK